MSTWENVALIEDDFDDVEDLGDLISTSRGERHVTRRHNGEYRRSNRFTEDGYGDLDFA
ncbi:hypothetical protein [Bradyrhizobium phage BDU-MI-1]|nr:hypothetical protein [Bradyrhizobium phage BDU-MI-1]